MTEDTYCPKCKAYVPNSVSVCLACGQKIVRDAMPQEEKPKVIVREVPRRRQHGVMLIIGDEEINCYIRKTWVETPYKIGEQRKRAFEVIEM